MLLNQQHNFQPQFNFWQKNDWSPRQTSWFFIKFLRHHKMGKLSKVVGVQFQKKSETTMSHDYSITLQKHEEVKIWSYLKNNMIQKYENFKILSDLKNQCDPKTAASVNICIMVPALSCWHFFPSTLALAKNKLFFWNQPTKEL